MSVRPALTADAEDIAAVLAELGHSASPGQIARRLGGLDADTRSAALVAVVETQVVGLLTLHTVPVLHEPGDWCRLTALVSAAEALAREAGCVRVEVTSALHRDGAHGFYRGRGYAEVSEHFLKPLGAADG